jgi:hypothetical protein
MGCIAALGAPLLHGSTDFHECSGEKAMTTDAETARQGLLKFIAKKGGAIPMRELHTHSLVFYQAGHQAFSQLMEGLVGDGLVTYDDATAVFTLTDTGRAAVGAA